MQGEPSLQANPQTKDMIIILSQTVVTGAVALPGRVVSIPGGGESRRPAAAVQSLAVLQRTPTNLATDKGSRAGLCRVTCVVVVVVGGLSVLILPIVGNVSPAVRAPVPFTEDNVLRIRRQQHRTI